MIRTLTEAHMAVAVANENLPPGADHLHSAESFRWPAPLRHEEREAVVSCWVDEKGAECGRVDQMTVDRRPDGSVMLVRPDGRTVKVREIEFIEYTVTTIPAAGVRIAFAEGLAIPALRHGERPIWPADVRPYPELMLAALKEAESPPPPLTVPGPRVETRRIPRDIYETGQGEGLHHR